MRTPPHAPSRPVAAFIGMALLCAAVLPAQKGGSILKAEAQGFPGSMSYGEEIEKPEARYPVHQLSSGQTPVGLGTIQVDQGQAVDAPKLHEDFASVTDTGWRPADPAIAGGRRHVIVATNGAIRVHRQDGTMLSQVTPKGFFAALGNTSGMSLFEPQAARDPWGGSRYVLMYNSRNTTGSNRNYIYLAISKTDDPTEGWWLYATDFSKVGNAGTNYYGVNPKLGMNSKSIYVVANMHSFSTGNFVYSKIRFFQNRSEMRKGTAGPKWWDRTGLNFYGTATKAVHMVPVINEQDNFVNGYPAHFVASVNGSGSYIYVWKARNTDDRSTGPLFSSQRVAVTSYQPGPDAPQMGSRIKIRNLGTRLNSAFYTGRTIYTVHSIKRVYGSNTVSALRYYEFNVHGWINNNTAPTVDQEVTFGTGSRHYLYPAVAPSGRGDVLIGFCATGTSMYPGLRYTGRRQWDAPNTLQTSATLKAGEAPYTTGASNGTVRWGEVTGISSNYFGRVHFVGPYARPGGKWGTWVGAFFAEPTVAPAAYRDINAPSYSYVFGRYDDQRIQLIDISQSGKGVMPYTGIAFRRDNRDYTNNPSLGREFDAKVTVSESVRNSYSASFNGNKDYNTKVVLQKKISFPKFAGNYSNAVPYLSGLYPSISFDQLYTFSGSSGRALVTEFLFQNGKLSNGSNFNLANYYLDAPSQKISDQGALSYYGTSCYDSGMTLSAYVAPGLEVYAKEANTFLQDKIRVSFNARTAKNSSVLFAFGVQGYQTGISLGACNNLHLNPVGIFAAPSDGNGLTSINLGYVAYKPIYAGASLFMQAGWADTGSGQLRLSRAGRRKLAAQPASPLFYAVHSSNPASATGNSPTVSSAYNPVRAYMH